MNVSRTLCVGIVFVSLLLPLPAWTQGAPAGTSGRPATEQEIRDVLVFNSPWESRATTPGQLYRFRTNFVARGDTLVAQVMRYATNEQGDSIVTVKDGKVAWQDTNGGDVTVSIQGAALVGTAVSKTATVAVLFYARP